MRRYLSSAVFALACVLLAACSPGVQDAASFSNQALQSNVRAPGAPFVPTGHIGAVQLIRLQSEGKLYSPLSHRTLVRMLHAVERRSHSRLPYLPTSVKGATVALWATLTQDNALLGESKKLAKTLTVVDTQANGCVYPVTVKVDASQNVWAGCEYNTNDDAGVYQEYSKSGALTATYQDGCPSPVSSCSEFYSESMDGAASSSYVFDALSYYYAAINCSPSCTYEFGGGFEYWPTGGSQSAPTLIALPYGQPVYGVAFMDLDSSGNVWFDYYGCGAGSQCGDGIGEITTPTSNPTFVSIEAPGYLQCSGGVYASGAGAVINVIDSCSRTIYRFNTSGSQTGKLGPILLGDPIAGGFNPGDARIAIGDEKGWLDVGTVKTNKWQTVASPYFRDGLMGAAYTPSDK